MNPSPSQKRCRSCRAIRRFICSSSNDWTWKLSWSFAALLRDRPDHSGQFPHRLADLRRVLANALHQGPYPDLLVHPAAEHRARRLTSAIIRCGWRRDSSYFSRPTWCTKLRRSWGRTYASQSRRTAGLRLEARRFWRGARLSKQRRPQPPGPSRPRPHRRATGPAHRRRTT